MTDYFSLLAKLDWEGYAGVEWLKDDTDDKTLNDLISAALDSWTDFKDDFDALENYLEERAEGEVNSTDPRPAE